MKKIIFLLIYYCFTSNLIAQEILAAESQKQVTARSCEENLYIGIKSIDPVDILWVDCTEDEPSDDDDYVHSSGYSFIYALINNVPYNNGMAMDDVERFWFLLGCCGEDYCVDEDDEQSIVSSNRFVFPNVDVCSETSIWVDMMTQCQDCNDAATAIRGHWWKTEVMFEANDLEMFTSSSSSFDIDPLQYQMLVTCQWQVPYGCDDNELN